MGRALSLAAALAALACAACVRLEYQRDLIDRVPAEDAIGELVLGESDLREILQRFGAPLDVWEGAEGSPVLFYGGLRSAEWDVSVSVELTQGGSASFSYGDVAARTRGVVMILDRDLRLQLVRAGFLRDLRLQTERPPPAPVEEGA